MESENLGRNRRHRRTFTPEFKAEAVSLVNQPGQSIYKVARNLGLVESALRRWVEQANIDAGNGSSGALTTAEKQELSALRRENRQLKLEREILRKATAFFAKEQM